MLKNNDDDILSLTGLFGIYNKKVRENQSLDVFHNNLKKIAMTKWYHEQDCLEFTKKILSENQTINLFHNNLKIAMTSIYYLQACLEITKKINMQEATNLFISQ